MLIPQYEIESHCHPLDIVREASGGADNEAI